MAPHHKGGQFVEALECVAFGVALNDVIADYHDTARWLLLQRVG